MHPFHSYREHQASHRRVGSLLKGEPAGAKEHSHSNAFSKVTSKTAAEHHDGKVSGHKSAKRFARGGKVKHSDEAEDKKLIKKMMTEHEKKEGDEGYARGGKVKHGHQTNIAIVVPHRPAGPAAGPVAGPAGVAPPPMAGPGLPAPGGMPGAPPPGMPMRARGGKVIDGEATGADIKKWGKRASANSYFRGGAATGVGREEKAEHMRRRRRG